MTHKPRKITVNNTEYKWHISSDGPKERVILILLNGKKIYEKTVREIAITPQDIKDIITDKGL